MRIATVHILLNVRTDAEGCDFVSELLGNADGIVDWQHIGQQNDQEITRFYEHNDPENYMEGEFSKEATEGSSEQLTDNANAPSGVARQLVEKAAEYGAGEQPSFLKLIHLSQTFALVAVAEALEARS